MLRAAINNMLIAGAQLAHGTPLAVDPVWRALKAKRDAQRSPRPYDTAAHKAMSKRVHQALKGAR